MDPGTTPSGQVQSTGELLASLLPGPAIPTSSPSAGAQGCDLTVTLHVHTSQE